MSDRAFWVSKCAPQPGPELQFKDRFPKTPKPERTQEAGSGGGGEGGSGGPCHEPGTITGLRGPYVPSAPKARAVGCGGQATWLGMALFLFSCVLLCWALKRKQREDSCGGMLGSTRWASLPCRGRGGSSRQRQREAPSTQRGAQGKELMQRENVFSYTEALRP